MRSDVGVLNSFMDNCGEEYRRRQLLLLKALLWCRPFTCAVVSACYNEVLWPFNTTGRYYSVGVVLLLECSPLQKSVFRCALCGRPRSQARPDVFTSGGS